MKTIYEAGEDEDGCGITVSTPENIRKEIARGMLDNAKLLYEIEADTFEEAMTLHYEKMGWSPYVPMGEAEECPNGCGAMFYPEGSGDCPNCGNIC